MIYSMAFGGSHAYCWVLSTGKGLIFKIRIGWLLKSLFPVFADVPGFYHLYTPDG